MKTTLLFTLFLLIAFKSFGQSDSVTISLTQANQIERQLRDCSLVKLQNIKLQEANIDQNNKINALQMQFSLSQVNTDELKELIAIYEDDLQRLGTWNFIWKVLVPLAFLGGLLVN